MPTLASSLFPSAYRSLLAEIAGDLADLDAGGLRRDLTVLEAVDGSTVRIGDKRLVCWCSNDYLGLSTHPRLIQAAHDAAQKWGVGARASRLLAGSTDLHRQLEARLASWFQAEAAIVYPSGYLANLGTLGSLLSRGDAIFIDRLAHASLWDAARSTGARLRFFGHNDLSHVATLLARASSARRRVIITEGVFSMDGDVPPLAELVEVAQTYDAWVYLDDAHGAFVMGQTGRGSPEAAGVPHERVLYMGTLGKALGAQGGFIVGPELLIRWLHHRARPFIYTTALAVPSVAAALEALRVVDEEPQRRKRLLELASVLRDRLQSLGGVPPGFSPIVPLILGEPNRSLRVAAALFAQGHWAPAIRPPTVPNHTARLRLSVTALHTRDQIEALTHTLRRILEQS